MVIDEKNNYIYIHIPKAAGTSITSFLTSNIKSSKKINTRGDTHHGIKTFLDDGLIKKSLNNYFKFITIRNPWDWYVSLYEFIKRSDCHEWRLFGWNDNPDFKIWLRRIVNTEIKDDVIRKFGKDHTSTSTLYKSIRFSDLDVGWLTHRYIYSTCLNWEFIFEKGFLSYVDSSNQMDDIFKVEYLTTNGFSNMFLKILGLQDQFRNHKRQNVTKNRGNYRVYYDDESKNWVLNKDNFLIKKFNYEF